MHEIFREVITEAHNKKVIIDDDIFPIAFNTIIMNKNSEILSNYDDSNVPTLIINDEELFLNKLDEYIKIALFKIKKFPFFSKDSEKNKIKILIAYLFANATTEDFNNPFDLLDRNIQFLCDDTFENLNDGIEVKLDNCLQSSNLQIKNSTQSLFMETPNKLEFTLYKYENGELLSYSLPSISYGITNNQNNEKECYIYNIINPKAMVEQSENQVRYSKKISRELYKINNGVMNNETVEYLDYKTGADTYYPENISDISVSAIVSLIAFISILEKLEIKRVKVVPYLPLRFLSRDIAADSQKDDNIRDKLLKRNDIIQSNITDKFIRNFNRAKYHLDGLNIDYYPYEFNEYMQLSINKINHDIDNYILNELYNNVYDAIHCYNQPFNRNR